MVATAAAPDLAGYGAAIRAFPLALQVGRHPVTGFSALDHARFVVVALPDPALDLARRRQPGY
jgi:hypothetical protein